MTESKGKDSGSDITVFAIHSENQFATPDGAGPATLRVECTRWGSITQIFFARKTLENGELKLSFDGSAPMQQTWTKIYRGAMAEAPREVENELIQRLIHAKTLEIEFTLQGAGPQRVNFTLLNLSELMERSALGKEALAEDKELDEERRSDAEVKSGKKWHISENQINGQDSVILTLKATNPIHTRSGDFTPQLYITCEEDPLISVGQLPAPESGNVTMVFDGGAPIHGKWYVLKQDDGFTVSSPIPVDRAMFFYRLLDTKRFSFEFTPRGSPRQTSVFEMDDFKHIVLSREKSCASWAHSQLYR